MKITIMASLLAKGNMEIDTGHGAKVIRNSELLSICVQEDEVEKSNERNEFG